MKYANLGPTGVKVSRICLGSATFGVAPNARDADHVVGTALDLGINFFDTANVYGILSVRHSWCELESLERLRPSSDVDCVTKVPGQGQSQHGKGFS